VISDVMMPKISGFEMLDILRNTDGLKDVKVIMLTALGQSEDKARADQLGADKYLVKSQVTLEDIVKTAHQLLDDPNTATATPQAPAAAAAVAPTDAPAADPPADDVVAAPTTAEETKTMQAQIDNFAAQAAAPAPEPAAAPAPAADDAAATAHDDQVMAEAVDSLTGTSDAQKPSEVTAVEVAPPAASAEPAPAAPAEQPHDAQDSEAENDSVTVAHKKVIKPINDPANSKPDLEKLLAQEEASQMVQDATGGTPATAPVAEAPADPTLAVSPELQAAMKEGEASAATPAPSAPATPVNVEEPPADPNKPNPNDIAL
jgi:CheY-like chemotaxis protein